MDITRSYTINKQNPARYLRRTLLDKGIREEMIYALMGRHDINDLIGMVERVEKIEGYDFPGLFVKMADKELSWKKPKPKQKRLFPQKRAKSEDLGGKMGD